MCGHGWRTASEELFITGKVFNNHHQPERVEKAIHSTLKNLHIPYLVRPFWIFFDREHSFHHPLRCAYADSVQVQDLYLIHWPIKFEDEEIAQPFLTPDGKLNPAIKWSFDFKETWKALYVIRICTTHTTLVPTDANSRPGGYMQRGTAKAGLGQVDRRE
jgi:hypothetical protein